MSENSKNGFILVDKPIKWTSFDIVKKIRTILRTQYAIKKIKVGHAGTLDPLATGLLILCVGKMTKSIYKFQELEKEYYGCIKLGSSTPSYDLETEVDRVYSYKHLTKEMIYQKTKNFTGKILQSPPIYSALKKNGVRLYEKARKGEKIKIEPRKVEVFKFEINKIELPNVYFNITCSKGTYIRSIAHDFGKSLNSGAHLTELCRRRIGNYNLNNAININTVKNIELITQ